MVTRIAFYALVIGSLGLSAAALAGAGATDGAGRYTMMPAEGGFIRLDTVTGIMSMCARRNEAWSCEPMPDSQTAMRDELSKLEAQNKKLSEELRQMEETFGLRSPAPGPQEGGAGAPDAGPPAPKAQIPSEKDVDQLFDYIEGMVRKFRERIERMEKEHGESRPPGSGEEAPGRQTPL